MFSNIVISYLRPKNRGFKSWIKPEIKNETFSALKWKNVLSGRTLSYFLPRYDTFENFHEPDEAIDNEADVAFLNPAICVLQLNRLQPYYWFFYWMVTGPKVVFQLFFWFQESAPLSRQHIGPLLSVTKIRKRKLTNFCFRFLKFVLSLALSTSSTVFVSVKKYWDVLSVTISV